MNISSKWTRQDSNILHDQLNPTQSESTTTHAVRGVAEMGTPEHWFLGPGCYRTAPAAPYGEFDNGDDYRNW